MLDQDLFFAVNQRPLVTPGANQLVWPFPLGLSGITAYDWQSIIDAGGGKPIYAHFRVTTDFTGHADNFLRFCIIVDSVPEFTNVNTLLSATGAVLSPLVIARGPAINTAGLKTFVSAGLGKAGTPPTEVEILVPTLNTLVIPGLADYGKRYLGLAMEASVTVANGDWTQGAVGIDAWISPHPQHVRPSAYPSGY